MVWSTISSLTKDGTLFNSVVLFKKFFYLRKLYLTFLRLEQNGKFFFTLIHMNYILAAGNLLKHIPISQMVPVFVYQQKFEVFGIYTAVYQIFQPTVRGNICIDILQFSIA